MALADITPKLNIDIDLTQATPRFTFQDATDYTAQSVTVADVEGNIKLVVNGSATPTYDNLDDWTTPDIDGGSVGQTNEDLTRFRTQASYISAPLDSNDELVSGLYAFTYQVSDDEGVTTVVTTVTYDIQYDKVTGDIDYTINLNPLSPSLKIEDTTSYAVDSVTPTNDRALTLYYPPNSALGGSTTTTAASLSVTSFNVGIQSAKLVNNVSYDFSSKVSTTASTTATGTPVITLDILDQITAVENKIEVESITSICDLYCCVKDFLTRLRQGTSTQKNALRQLAGEVAIYLEMISDAYACGKGDDINTYVAAIKDLVGCNDDCGCGSGTTPTVIQAISVGGIPVNNKFVYTGLSNPTTYTEPLLIGLTYDTVGSPRRNDFDVFVGSAGQLDNLSAFDSTTGKMTFSGAVTTTFSIIRYR
jgi:hypothetical protein